MGWLRILRKSLGERKLETGTDGYARVLVDRQGGGSGPPLVLKCRGSEVVSVSYKQTYCGNTLSNVFDVCLKGT